ncbi:MAG: hypothetical protein A4E72_01789 [Syntrophus sp. PtaU1.Bin208]|nr:MAG: hypothetical protein A4E72_01789 [Syntrophus sp. PtaU1.Bin208]
MTNRFSKKTSWILGLMGVLLSGILLFAGPTTAEAADRGNPYGGPRGGAYRSSPQHSPHVVKGGSPHREFRDTRYHHNRSYPVHGQTYRKVPHGAHHAHHGGHHYYYYGGVWYRPYGAYFSVVVPPFGLYVPFLPPYYTTVWVGGAPYYYANEIYYAHQGAGYVVVPPPKEEVSQAPPPAEELFIYPRLGQSEQQQADDRYQCHRWAVEQTGFDPTQPPESRTRGTRADYQRAMGACLDGRGYTVK